MTPTTWTYVRATINMRGLRAGSEAWVDLSDPQFGPLLEARYLIPVDPPFGETAPSSEVPDGD